MDSDSDYDPDFDQYEEVDEEKKAEDVCAASNGWTPTEEALLEMALAAYPADMYPAAFERCVLVASQLPNKTARDVALRIRQLNAQREVDEGHVTKLKGENTSKKRGSGRQLPPLPKAVASNAQRSPRAKSTKQSSKAAGGAFARDAPPPPTHSIPAPIPADPVLLPLPPPCAKRLLPSLSASCLFVQPNSNPSTSNSVSEEEGLLVDMVGGTSSIHQDGDLLISGMPGLHNNSNGLITSGLELGGAKSNLLDGEGVFVHNKPPSPSLEATSLNEIRSLMEQNYSLLNNIKDNMQQCNVVENTELLTRFRDNVLSCIGQMTSLSMSGQMPPLPERPNLELAAKFLPPRPGMTLLPPVVPPFVAQIEGGSGGQVAGQVKLMVPPPT